LTIICGPVSQSLSLTDVAPLFLDADKNTGASVLLLNTTEVQELFIRAEPTRCPIETYDIYTNDTETLITPGHPFHDPFLLGDRVDAELRLDTTFLSSKTDGTITTVDYPFKIKAVAEGGAFIWKQFVARVVVCRYESVTLLQPTPVQNTLQVRVDSQVAYSVTGRFASNDTAFCPVNHFEVVLSDQDVASAVRPTTSQRENVDMTDDTNWRVFPRDPGTINYWIQGRTASNQYANAIGVLVNFCGLNSNVIAPAAESFYQRVDKNQGTISLVSAPALLAYFTQADPERCEITQIKTERDGNFLEDVYNTPGYNAEAFLYNLLDIANRGDKLSQLNIKSDVALTDGTIEKFSYTVDLKAFASALNDITVATLNFDIIVCETEVISPISANPIEVVLDIGPTAVEDRRDLNNFFTTSDNYCPAISFYAKISNSSPTVEGAANPSLQQLDNYRVEGNEVVMFPQDEGTYQFFIYGESVTGKIGIQEFDLTVQCVQTSQTITPAQSGRLIVPMVKNENIVELLSPAELREIFILSDTERC
jgi:hypothetical protein